MGEDEEATIRTLTAYRAVMASLIQQHRGRVVDSPGDNLLAEFASVVDAVRCAVEVQQALKAKNADLPDHRKMEHRIGINVGDIVIEGERIYGDGVNIAARLESLADVGGLCVSGTVYDQVKNIKQPVRVYRVETELQSFAHTVNASEIEASDTSATPLRLVRQKSQHAGAPPFACSRNRRWLPRQLRLHWRGAMAFLATGIAM